MQIFETTAASRFTIAAPRLACLFTLIWLSRVNSAVEATPVVMQPDWRWFLITPAGPADAAPDTESAVAVEPADAAGWLRWAISVDSTQATTAGITVAANATCSLYLNGQRLMKQKSLSGSGEGVSAAGWEVLPLLRNGRNQIAIEIHGPRSGAIVGVALDCRAGDQPVPVSGGFRLTQVPPPVGWQQTDFNDLDWPEVQPLERPPESTALPDPVAEYQAPSAVPRQRSAPLRFEDGDHVVLIGATFMERAQLFEHLESTLTGTCDTRRVTFRNLGWSADTVWSDSRGIFDAPEVGFLRLVEHVRAEEPTVAIVCYGQNEALTPGITPEEFRRQLGRLLDELTVSGIACVLLSPHELFPARTPLPSPSRFNPQIELFSLAAADAARSRGLLFVDLFANFQQQMRQIHREMTSPFLLSGTLPDLGHVEDEERTMISAALAGNGMHLTDQGYAIASLIVRERLLMLPARFPTVMIDGPRRKVLSADVQIRQTEWSEDGRSVRFEVREPQLSPLPLRLHVVSADRTVHRMKGSAGEGDSAGTFESALMDGAGPRSAPGRSALVQLPVNPQYEALRNTIRNKNELYFHRWRPQNITYLFGFRKHEQGNNAADIARFDPLIRDLEDRIFTLQQPQWRRVTVELVE